MKKVREFDFSKARKVTPQETEMYRRAIENTFGIERPRRGRPLHGPKKKYRDVHIKIHPQALKWVKNRAKKRGIGYQTVINEILLSHAA